MRSPWLLSPKSFYKDWDSPEQQDRRREFSSVFSVHEDDYRWRVETSLDTFFNFYQIEIDSDQGPRHTFKIPWDCLLDAGDELRRINFFSSPREIWTIAADESPSWTYGRIHLFNKDCGGDPGMKKFTVDVGSAGYEYTNLTQFYIEYFLKEFVHLIEQSAHYRLHVEELENPKRFKRRTLVI